MENMEFVMTECGIESTNQVGYRFSGQPMIGKINLNPTNTDHV